MPTTRTLATNLLPLDYGLRLEDVSIGPDQIVATLEASASRATCPVCGIWSEAIHSLYRRTIADLPWGLQTVRLHLCVRKFFCRQPTCTRRVFSERLPRVVAPYARRTKRLTEVVRLLAFALGGEPGARSVERLGMATSPATLLRLIRRTAVIEAPTPRALGVDDWAQRKRHTYGTILIDLEEHRLIDLLPDRTADTLAAWLQDRPGIEIISRDRSGAYADGAARGAPDAMQVADRFHLTRNLGEVLDRCFNRYRGEIREIERPDSPSRTKDEPPTPIRPAPPRPSLEADKERKRAARQERYTLIRERYLKGASISELARELKLHWKTVRKYAQADQCPERPLRPQRPRLLTPYEPYLLQRWEEGCHNGVRLYREIAAQGFGGSRIHVARFVAQLRRDQLADPTIAAGATPGPSVGLTPRDAAWLVIRPVQERTPAEQTALDQLMQLAPDLERAVVLSERFLVLLRQRQGSLACDQWVTEAAASSVPELRRFAIKLKQDLSAVGAACRETWSNGQTEGHVHKLKLLKRSMYGRAKFDLLRLRLLNAA
jgi:transposase